MAKSGVRALRPDCPTFRFAPCGLRVTSVHFKRPAPAADAAAVEPDPRETALGLAGSAAAEAPAVEDPPEEGSTPPSETHERLVSLFRPEAPMEENSRPAAGPIEIVDE